MKCGRQIGEDRVFCPDCLADMEKYPVKPGTAVHIPVRKATHPRKNPPKKKQAAPEEQVLHMRKVIRFLAGLWLATLLIAAALAYPAYRYLTEENQFLPGQNYSVIDEQLTPEG
jgi:hypothetical protein